MSPTLFIISIEISNNRSIEISKIRKFENSKNLLHPSYLYKILGNLHGIERCSLAYLVASEPQGDAIVVGKVLTHTSNVDIILACALKRHRVNILLRVILKGHTGSGCESLANLADSERLLCLNPYRL